MILWAAAIGGSADSVIRTVCHSGAGALMAHPGTILSAACILELARIRWREASRARREAEQAEKVDALSDSLRCAFRYGGFPTPPRGWQVIPGGRALRRNGDARHPAARASSARGR